MTTYQPFAIGSRVSFKGDDQEPCAGVVLQMQFRVTSSGRTEVKLIIGTAGGLHYVRTSRQCKHAD